MLTLRSYIFLNVFQLPDVFYLVGTNCYPFGIPFWTGDNRDRTQGCAADPRQMHQFVRWCFFHMEAMPQKSRLRLSTDSAGMFDESLNFSHSFEMVVISPDTTAKIFYLDSLTMLNCVCGTMGGRGELQAHLYQLVQLPTMHFDVLLAFFKQANIGTARVSLSHTGLGTCSMWIKNLELCTWRGESGRHSDATGRASASYRQRPGLDPDLLWSLSGVGISFLRQHGFHLGARLSSRVPKVAPNV